MENDVAQCEEVLSYSCNVKVDIYISILSLFLAVLFDFGVVKNIALTWEKSNSQVQAYIDDIRILVMMG